MHIVMRCGLGLAAGASVFAGGVLTGHAGTSLASYGLAAAAITAVSPLVFILGWHTSRTSLVIYRDRPIYNGDVLPAGRREVRRAAPDVPPRIIDDPGAKLEVVESTSPAVLAHYEALRIQRENR